MTMVLFLFYLGANHNGCVSIRKKLQVYKNGVITGCTNLIRIVLVKACIL